MATNATENLPVGGEGMAFNDWCVANSTPGLSCLPYGTDVSGLDPERLIFPFEGINYTGCDEDLLGTDFDGNGQVSAREYQNFVYQTAARRCQEWPELTLQQRMLFNSLACQCGSQQVATGERADCCVGDRAHIANAGALQPATRSEPQSVFLENVCVVTYSTLPGTNCSIKVLPVNDPPPIIIDPFRAGTGTADGHRWTLVAAMLATALLLLLLCCCCCTVRQRKRKEYEEEEIIETEYPGKEEWLEEPMQEQAPLPVAPPVAQSEDLVAEPGERESPPVDEESEYSGEGGNRGGGYEDDEDDDGEGRRRRGGNYVGEEEEDTRRRWPGGEIPDNERDQEVVQLKPIPPKDPPPPEEWDEPMRNIDEIKPPPDDDSVQKFDRHIPETGVHDPQRPQKDPVTWKNNWQRGEKPEGDEDDGRKHRIQGGLGDQEIWDRLDQDSNSKSTTRGGTGDAFDWVVNSALNVMENADDQGHLVGDDDSTVPPADKS